MNTHRTFYFWHHTPSPHLAPFIKALAERLGAASVTVILTGELSEHRLGMGWNQPNFGSAQIIQNPKVTDIQTLLALAPENSVHLFSEISIDPLLKETLTKACRTKALVGLISEGRDPRGIKGLIRRAQSLWLEKPLANSLDFLLAIGHLASDWYALCGFPQAKIFPFCYVVEAPETLPTIPLDDTGVVQLSYIGQLIPRKRVDILIEALTGLQALPWKLDIIGSGPEQARLARLVRAFPKRVQFHGALDNRTAREKLATTDVLILPSHWDGWGAVVNEALMAGARVICSQHCGAADLLVDHPHLGLSFATDSASALQSAIEQQVSKGKITESERASNRVLAHNISSHRVAEYFLSIAHHFDHPLSSGKPKPPWCLQ